MNRFVTIVSILFLDFIVIYLSCTKDTHFNPTEEIGVTIEAYVCDTTDLDTTITLSDSLSGTVTALSVYAGQTITFLGFIKGDSINDITCSWDFGDTITSASRIVEHRYMSAGDYKALVTITNSVGVSLSDIVSISVLAVQGAAVKGYAFLQGKTEHDNIKILFYSLIDTTALVTERSGLFQMLSNFPALIYYNVMFIDEKNGYFTPETLTNINIENGLLNELGRQVLKDNYKPHIVYISPTGTIDNRIPSIQASLIDTASGIAPETFLLVFNSDTIPDSLIACNDSSFSWKSLSRLPDGNCSVFATVSDSAGNSVNKTWGFTVDAMKLTVMQDTMVPINATVNVHGKVSDVYSKVVQYRWDFNGDGQWDDSVVTSDTVISWPWVYTHEDIYGAILYVRDDSGMVKLDTVIITVLQDAPIPTASTTTPTVSINDTIRLQGTATDVYGQIVKWEWDAGNTGIFTETTPDSNYSAIAPLTENSTYPCVLRVTDNDGNIALDTVTVNVLTGVPIPTASTTTPTVSINDTILLQGTATDVYGKIVKWEWDAGNTGTFIETTPDSNYTTIASSPQNLNYQCVLKVTDDDYNVAKDTVCISIFSGQIIDIDGNVYHTVNIGNQEWTVENLRVAHYNDGSAILHVADSAEWAACTSGTAAYCYYDNDSAAYAEKYGALYNWYAVNTGKLAPEGWHVPTDAEWKELENYLIANGYNWDGTITGNKIGKSMAAKTDWNSSVIAGAVGNDLSSNNSSGFSALPGGSRSGDGSFYYQSYRGYWWSSTEGAPSGGLHRYLTYNLEYLDKLDGSGRHGFSVRLLRDN